MPKPPNNNESNAFALAVTPDIDMEAPRDERMAQALAMVRMGASIQMAATAANIAPRTLRDVVYKDPETLNEREKEIEQLAFEAVLLASEKIMEMLEQNMMRPAEVTKALQVMRDTVSMRRKWNTPPVEVNVGKESWLDKMLRGIEATEKAANEGQPIDVTPGGSDDKV